MEPCVSALKNWTGKTHVRTIFDSSVDEFTNQSFLDKLMGKRNVALIAVTTDGDVFGGFYNRPVTQQCKEFRDPSIFAFSFESHGRCATPQRFVVGGMMKGKLLVSFWKSDVRGFVWFRVDGGGWFWLGNEGSNSYCYSMSKGFWDLEDTTLTGKSGLEKKDQHHCVRLVAFQLE